MPMAGYDQEKSISLLMLVLRYRIPPMSAPLQEGVMQQEVFRNDREAFVALVK